jgi:hypothetical protein
MLECVFVLLYSIFIDKGSAVVGFGCMLWMQDNLEEEIVWMIFRQEERLINLHDKYIT